jgi:hypothetical protein
MERSKTCPFLKSCTKLVTEHNFLHVCNSLSFRACQVYAGRVKKLNTPMVWLQKLAVEAMDKNLEHQYLPGHSFPNLKKR